jgi:hypothetical protein
MVPTRGFVPRDKGRVLFSLRNEGDRGEIGRGRIPNGFNRTCHDSGTGLNSRGSDPGRPTGVWA